MLKDSELLRVQGLWLTIQLGAETSKTAAQTAIKEHECLTYFDGLGL